MANIMTALRAPLCGFTESDIQNASRIDYLNDETGLPKSDVLSFTLPSGFKFIVRPSGTEPKLKAYLFAQGPDQKAAEKELDVLETMVRSYCDA